MKLKGFFLLILAAATVAALWPATGGAAGFRGVVVAKQRGTLLVASPAGVVRAIAGRAAVGSRIAFGGGHATVVGRASTARIHGIVVRRIGTTLFMSSNRHLLALRAARVVASTAPAAPGTVIDAQVAIQNGQLDEQNENEVGQAGSSSVSVQATVAAVAAGSVTLTVQGQTLTVSLPAGLTLPATLVGQTATIQVSFAADQNEGNQNQDDQDDDQGDGGNGGDQHGGGGGGGGDD